MALKHSGFVLPTGHAIQTGITAGNTFLLQAYDNDTGPGYVTFITLTAGNTPSLTIDNATITTLNTGLHILDTNASHDLIIAPGSDLTADHTLTLTTGDADRTLTLSGNLTVESASLINQDVTSDANVTFGTVNKLTLTAPANGSTLTIADGKTLTVSNTITLAGTDAQTYTFPAASDTVACLGTQQTFSKGQTITIPNAGNVDAFTINQNDVTYIKYAQVINNAGTNGALRIMNTGVLKATEQSVLVYSNAAQTTGNALVNFILDHASSTISLLNLQQDGTGKGLFIDQNTNNFALDIDKDCTVNDTRTWAMQIASDNAGTGTALGCGIDMSSFAVDEPLLKAPADAITTAGAVAGQIAIDVGGTTYYIAYGAAGT
jgi:hypothetical protein